MPTILASKDKWTLFLFSAFVNLLGLTGSIYMLQIYDRVLSTYSIPTLVGFTVLALSLLLLMAIVDAARHWFMIRVANRFSGALSDECLPQALREPHVISPAVLSAQLGKIKAYLTSPGFFAVWDFPWTILYILLIFSLHWMLGLAALGGGIVLVLISVTNHYLARRTNEEAEGDSAKAQMQLASANANAESVTGLRMQSAILDRWRRYQNRSLNTLSQAQESNAFFTALTKGVRQCLQVIILAVGAYLVIHQQILPGVMIAASIIMGRALMPIEQSIGQWRQTREARHAMANINKARVAFSDVPENKVVPEQIEGNLKTTQLSYAVSADARPILQDLSIEISAGQLLVIFGRSGSGKSTIVKLLTGALQPTNGEVLIDGLSLAEWPDERLREAIGYLPQNVQLLPGTVAENIASMRTELDTQQVITAAKTAQAHEMIMQLPQGYETRIGSGHAVSGGQAQRIAWARALYTDPSIIIIDEPNAALDDIGNQALVKSLQTLKAAGKTIIISSHYKSLMQLSDQVLILEQGSVKLYGATEKIRQTLNQQNQQNQQHQRQADQNVSNRQSATQMRHE